MKSNQVSTGGLDVIVIDDDPGIGQVLKELIESFYSWGEVVCFSGTDQALAYCISREVGVAIFVIDVFLRGMSGFSFLDSIESRFPSAHEDAIMISGKASDDVVDMCLASNVGYLLEKPVKPYALQLAVRAITNKYLRFAQKLLRDPGIARTIAGLSSRAA
jgi:DNA-binding NtrC family response regulator